MVLFCRLWPFAPGIRSVASVRGIEALHRSPGNYFKAEEYLSIFQISIEYIQSKTVHLKFPVCISLLFPPRWRGIMQYSHFLFATLCRWQTDGSSAFTDLSHSKNKKLPSHLPAHPPSVKTVVLGRRIILIPRFIQSSPTLAVYDIAHSPCEYSIKVPGSISHEQGPDFDDLKLL